MFARTLLFTLLASLTFNVSAQEITLNHQGITLNANLQQIDDQPLDGKVVLITHGTLAHKGMEIIATLQQLLADEEIPSLAINLSLGIDNRQGMYECEVPHSHKHTDALAEIDLWKEWLLQQGASEIILIGHSRGGNQTAWYSDLHNSSVTAQILIAPATWSKADTHASYERSYKTDLNILMQHAQSLAPDSWMEDTDFIYCKNSRVKASSFIDYYRDESRFDTPTLLQTTSVPSLVIIGTEDKTVSNLPEAMAKVGNPIVKTVTIEGANHFFRDLYADEAIEAILSFLEQ